MISILTQNISCPQVTDIHGIQHEVSRVLEEFLDAMPCPIHIKSYGMNDKLRAAMRTDIKTRNLSSQLEHIVPLAASLIELAYPGLTLAEKLLPALFTCCLVYIDDKSPREIAPFIAFERRFLQRLPQLDPVLDALAYFLLSMYDQYDTAAANAILSSTFEFINANCIEPQIDALPFVYGATHFPWFLRDRSGGSLIYAIMLFPRSRGVDFTVYFRALADMNFWMSVSNDLLSFYKEALAGETANYISNRAQIEAKAPMQVFSDIKDELLEASRNITAILAISTEGARAWKNFESGYIEWHLRNDRYMLKDLNIERKE